MPTVLTNFLEMPPPQVPPRKRWTREQCAPLEASGLFEKERLELVDGDLISKMGKNRSHVNALMSLLVWLQKAFGDQFVDAEAPIDVSQADNIMNEPEPDLIVLARERTYFNDNPEPQDIRLLVEISDSSLKYDLTVKAALYARAGVTDYWVLDVAGRRLLVHRGPASGKYTSVIIYSEFESVAPLAAPTCQFCPAQAFPT